MKPSLRLILFLAVVFTFSSCKKETGTQGPAGTNGNANIKEFTFTGISLGTAPHVDSLSGVNFSSLDSSLLLVYIQDAACGTTWYSVPGLGCGAGYMIRVFTQQGNGSTTLLFLGITNPDATTYSGALVTLTKMRVIIAPASTFISGKGGIDFSDYNFVKQYFHLKD